MDHILLGSDLEKMDEQHLAEGSRNHSPSLPTFPGPESLGGGSLQAKGHTVGFMGDGINDAPALKMADIGISVDSAVDIAKESADIILLEKSPMVLEEGIVEGRKTSTPT